MENLEDKINAILSNPQMIEQITSIAQSLGQSQSDGSEDAKINVTPGLPNIDFAMIQNLSNVVQQSGIDSNQQTLLHALSPYLSNDRVSRLERAMRAAKMAQFASSFLGTNGLHISSGR